MVKAAKKAAKKPMPQSVARREALSNIKNQYGNLSDSGTKYVRVWVCVHVFLILHPLAHAYHAPPYAGLIRK